NDRRHGNQRHLELRVEPLDLDDAARVGIQIESTIRPEHRLHGNDPGRTGIDDGGVIGSGLAIGHVDLDTDNALGLADLADEIEAAACPAVPLNVVDVEV